MILSLAVAGAESAACAKVGMQGTVLNLYWNEVVVGLQESARCSQHCLLLIVLASST